MCYVHSALWFFWGGALVRCGLLLSVVCAQSTQAEFFFFATQSRFFATDMNRSWGSFPGKEFLSFGGGRRETREKGCWLKKINKRGCFYSEQRFMLTAQEL